MKAWVPLFIYLCVQCITPGPNNLTSLFLGATKGLKGLRPFLTGSMAALFVKALLCGLFNIALARYVPQAARILKWIGAAYMLYLAFVMARSGWVEESDGKAPAHDGAKARDGITLQLLNGKSWIVAVSMFAVYVIPVSTGFPAVVFASALFVVLALACSLIWGAFGSGLKTLIARYRKPFGIVMGLSLVWCAVTAVL